MTDAREQELKRLLLALAERIFLQSELLSRRAERIMSFTFPPAVLHDHVAILGKTGSGKSSTAKLLIEQVVSTGGRVCILDPIKSDWWGITLSADGRKPALPFKIIGGPQGHVALHSSAGEAIGRLVGTGKLPLSIIDMADFEPGGLQRFWVDFAAALWKNNRGVVYLVIEEAHEFAPKEMSGIGKESVAIHWAKRFGTGSRTKGIRLVLNTQRVQSLHNALLGSCETIVAHRLTTPADQKPVLDWLKLHTDGETVKAVATSLASLPTGTGWLCSGEAKIFAKQKFPLFATYDNTSTPTGDDGPAVRPPSVDQEELRGIIGDAVKEAEENDPKTLKDQLAKLRAELAKRPGTSSPSPGDAMSSAVEMKLDTLIGLMSKQVGPFPPPPRPGMPPPPRPPWQTPPASSPSPPDEEALYQRFKARLLLEVPLWGGNNITVTPPEKLRKDFQTAEVERIMEKVGELNPLQRLILKFVEAVSGATGQATIATRIGRANNGDFGKAVKHLASLGFVENKERVGVKSTLRFKIATDLESYQPTEGEIENVYQSILFEIATEAKE